jgi:hypothetical protein
MRSLRVGFLAVLVAALVPAAHAKGPSSGQLCGESGCSRLRGYEQLAAPNRSSSACPVTDIRGKRPPDPALPFNYGNDRIRVAYVPKNGHLVAGRLPGGGWRATINDDGSIDAKFGWWRAGSGKIRITGRRLDVAAPPLRAHVPDGYSAGFQATGLTFPTTGCWRVTGRYGAASLTFTMLVTKSPLGP